jgi:uncharacterized Ntn-hydrolase superfamily protein
VGGALTTLCREYVDAKVAQQLLDYDDLLLYWQLLMAERDIAAGIGAVATQALFNPFYGTNGLRLLRESQAADRVVKAVIAADDGREHRQLHVMDSEGRVAAHIGAACIDWKGHVQGDGFSIAGNMLAGARVLDDTAAAYLAHETLPFPRRLIAAMRAGEAAGAHGAGGGLALAARHCLARLGAGADPPLLGR